MSGLAVERRGEAAWLWLDRPERRNAFDAALIAALHEAVEAAGADPEVRALVLAGARRALLRRRRRRLDARLAAS